MEQNKNEEIYRIPSSDAALLSECDVETFCSTGPGGQNVNKRETAVRLRHLPTGLLVTCQEERTQYRNKKIALKNLRRKLEKRMQKRRFRVPTTAPRELKEKILENKKRQSRKKQDRRTPMID